MNDDPAMQVAKLAVAAVVTGGLARIALALHGGTRGLRLLVEGFVGAMLGVASAGIALWVDNGLEHDGLAPLILAGVAGLSGAMGTRALDLMESAIRKRLG